MSDPRVNALVKARDGFRQVADAFDEYLETLAPSGAKGRESSKTEVDLSRISGSRPTAPRALMSQLTTPLTPYFRSLQGFWLSIRAKCA